MDVLSFAEMTVGHELPALTLPPIDRTTLALFAGASGDHHPIHIDLDYARRAGAADVFAHGMLGMAWLARVVTGWVPQSALRRLDVRFQGVIHLQNAITCRGTVIGKEEQDGERRLRLALESVNQYGETKIVGEALVAWP